VVRLSEVRAPNYKLAENDYISGMKYKDIAIKYNVSLSTVKSWKTRYDWNRNSTHTKDKKVCVQKKDAEPIDDGTKGTILNENLTHEQRLFCIYYSKIFNAAQSYQKAYGCTYESAMVNGSNLLRNTKVREEIQRLNEIKRQQIVSSIDDMIDLHMRIAFADIGNYLTFGQRAVPQWKKNKDDNYIEEIDPNTGEQKVIYYNEVNLKESANIDTQLIQEVKEGKEGISIKLADKQKSLDWLDHYFLMNPLDRHKIEFDNKKLEFERKKLEPDPVSNDGIKDFLKAVNPTKEDIEAMFKDEGVNEDAEDKEE